MFKPRSTQKINDYLYVVRSGIVNFFIFQMKNELIVFDTGMSKAMAKSGFHKLGLDYNRVTHVFLTHSDSDHMGAYQLFSNATIHLSEKEKPMVSGSKARTLGLVHNKKMDLGTDLVP